MYFERIYNIYILFDIWYSYGMVQYILFDNRVFKKSKRKKMITQNDFYQVVSLVLLNLLRKTNPSW